MIVVANIGYLPGLILKELSAGRKCELTGGICLSIDNREDYDRKKDKLTGKFGEVVARKSNGVALIATRTPPPWAEKKIDEVIWDCEEMLRWDVPKEQR
jgi:hypothetical protein